MLTKDTLEKNQEAESLQFMESLLEEEFLHTNRNVLVVSDDYYEYKENKPYQICQMAIKLGIMDKACENYSVEYEIKNYNYNKDTYRNIRSMFIFKRKEKQKELVKTHPLCSKYPHK